MTEALLSLIVCHKSNFGAVKVKWPHNVALTIILNQGRGHNETIPLGFDRFPLTFELKTSSVSR